MRRCAILLTQCSQIENWEIKKINCKRVLFNKHDWILICFRRFFLAGRWAFFSAWSSSSWRWSTHVTGPLTPLWKWTCLSFYLNYTTITYRNVVLVLDQVKWLCGLLAFHAKNTLLRPSHLEHVFSNIEYLCGTWVSDLFLSLQTYFDRVVHLDFRFRVVSCKGAWCPLGVHLSNTLLHVKLYVDLLIRCQFDDGDSQFFSLAYVGKIGDWLDGPFLLLFVVHGAKNRFNIKGGYFADFLICVFDTENKILFAPSAILDFFNGALAFPGVIKLIGFVTDEGNEADSLAEPLIMEYWGVLDDANEMRGQGGYLWDEDSAESIRQAYVTTRQWKLQLFWTDV